jgi:hypothetical protein
MGDVVKSESNIMINPESLIAKGIENNLSIEGMQKLLDMRRQLKDENAREEFFKALSEFQSECPTIEKKKCVYAKNGTTVTYRYAPIEDIISQIKDTLKKFGFSYTLKTRQTDNTVTVICEAHHAAGHTESTEITVPAETSVYMSAVQNIGSATTYAKRYSFCNAFGIMTGDEDKEEQEPEEPKKKKGVLQNAINAIKNAKTGDDIARIKKLVPLSEWTEQEGIAIDDALKNAETAIKEGVK